MANSKNITFDQLQNALTRVKSALDGKANASHGNHVPKTETANNAKFLRNDNTWQTVTPVNIGAADRSHSHGSYVNQNAFTNIKVGDTTVAADSPTDTLTLTAGANVTLTPDATNDTVTIAAKDTVYTHPTTSGNKHIPSGGSSGQILKWSADGTAAWGSDNNTDTKVTNTLNTTAKAYVTGTTSATTNTGTQVFDTGVYLDTTAGKLVASTFEGALSGNASSATKLQTARSINGTNFDGSGNITTANWGASRTLTVGNTGKSVNGGGNVSWSIDEIGALKASKLGGTDINTLKTTGRYLIKGTPVNAPTTNNGVIDVAWDVGTPYQIFYPDGVNTAYKRTWNSSNSTWNGWAQLMFTDTNTWRGIQNNLTSDATDQSLSAAQGKVLKGLVDGKAAASHSHNYAGSSSAGGSANTAVKLATAKNINGTSFDGSANITTANWGTSRTLTIGSTGKSVNGSGNVSWTLDEIGAAAKSHGNHVPATQTADNKKFLRNDNTWQTVTPANIGAVPIDTGGNITIHADSDANSTSEYALIKAGHNELKVASSAGGGTVTKGQDKLTFNGNIVYHAGRKPTLSELGAAAASHTHDYAAKSHTHNYAGSSSAGGNANAAVKLATARTLTIGNTGKNFDGSGNVSWSLSEIGAAASNHTHSYAASNHNHDSAYLKLSGGTLSGQLTVNNNVQAQGLCVSKNSKEVWLDIGDNDTYLWASGANKSLQITHDGALNFDGQPVLYGGRGNNYDTATSTIYFNNAGVSHKGRISCYNNSDGDYVQLALRTADATTNYLTIRTDTVNFGSPIVVKGHKLTIDSSAPSNPDTGDVWINIG